MSNYRALRAVIRFLTGAALLAIAAYCALLLLLLIIDPANCCDYLWHD